jgi:hypothetical protein
MSPALKVRRRKCNIVIWVSYCGSRQAGEEQRETLPSSGQELAAAQTDVVGGIEQGDWLIESGGWAAALQRKCRGASLRGQGSPGFILPASAVSEQENCAVTQTAKLAQGL